MSYFTARRKQSTRFQKASLFLFFATLPVFAPTAAACEVLFVRSSESLVGMADTIVITTPLEYAMKLDRRTRDEPILFQVIETLRGIVRSKIALPGVLVSEDDFNDQRPPYQSVRPSGRWGTCFAGTYRVGAQYLLLLKTTESGALSVKWSPLSPVNEQLHSATDAWLLWVRKEIHRAYLESRKL